MKQRLLLSMLLPFAFCGLQWLLWEHLKPYVWLLFFPAAFFSAWIGGLRGGLAGTAIGALLAWYVFIPPAFSFSHDNQANTFSIVVFVLMGSLFAYFFERLHQAQARSETRFEATFEQAAVGIALVAPNGHWLRVNRKLCDIVGYRADELMLKTFQDITHPDDLNSDLEYVSQMLAGDIATYSLEKRYRRKDGDATWINLSVALVRTADGAPDYFISVVEDIQARKDAEANLTEAKRLAKLGHWHWDLRTDRHTWSEEIHSIYGRDPALPPAVYPEVSACFTPESWARLAAAVEYTRTTGHAYECDAEVVRPDGTNRWITARGEVERDADGKISVMRGTVQDITERKQAEEEIRRLNADLERRVTERTAELSSANRELDSFAYAVSHDLRAPLRAMSGFSQALLEDYGEQLADDEARKYLNQIDLASHRMSDLIDGILALSRSTRGDLQRDRIDISDLATRRLATLSLEDTSRRVHWQVEPGLSLVGNASMLEAVCENLLDNAWKYTGRTAAPEIRVYADNHDSQRWLCIADNGAGFDMAHAERLFKPFQRLHRQDEFPGIGIGLATVQRIIHRHGGEITARGEPGRGATFCFTLPDMAIPDESE